MLSDLPAVGASGQVAELMKQMDEEHDSEDEGIEDYKIGGYHPVHVGEVLHQRYVIIQKLGWGHFSTVWLAKDFKFDTYVALKIQKSASHYLEAAYDEVEILQKVARNVNNPEWLSSLKQYYPNQQNHNSNQANETHTIQLLNAFVYKGPYGHHFCFVFEILGVNLLEVIKRYNYKGVPMNICRQIAKQILIGLDFLHRICGVIHTDLKPENVLLCLSEEEIKDIVENGQLTKNQIFKERIHKYRQILNIPETSLVDLDAKQPPQSQSQQQKQEEEEEQLSKTQKKNRKKRIQKKKKKLDQEEENENGEEEKQLFTAKDEEKIKFNNFTGLPKDFKIKIADLGNACWIHHHFSTLIQTRQYRSPEVLIGSKYNPTADMWSLSCMIFEMLTGDFLFEPRQGPSFSKNDDHLAQVQELLGKLPADYALRGSKGKRYFDKNGNLKRIPQLHFWQLMNVLVEKYRFKLDEARMFNDFLSPMLSLMPEHRQTAQEALLLELFPDYQPKLNPFNLQRKSNWLNFLSIGDHKMTEEEFQEYQKSKKIDPDDVQQLPHTKPDRPKAYIYEYEGSNSASVSEDHTPLILEKAATRYVEHRLIDRSFTDLGYIGYGEGIDLEQLDSTGNWQFQ